MAIMKIRGIGGKGVIKDLPAFELPPEAWNDSRNVRFAAQRIEKMGGYFPVLMEDMPEDPPLAILTRNNTQSQIYATAKHIYIIEGRTHRDISQTSDNPDYKPPFITDPTDPSKEIPNPAYDPDIPEKLVKEYDASPASTWYYTTLSNAIVLNTPKGVPVGLRAADREVIELPGWGIPNKPAEGKDPTKETWEAGRIRSFRNYLVALDMTEGAINIPQRVRWSNVSYVNTLPPDWYQNVETSDGGFNDLTDANGRIVDGVPLRDSFVIYTDQETYLMEYVGGILIFNFKKLFSDSGILAPECAVEFEQKHFVISKDDIFVHNGSSKQPVASGRVKQFLIDEISSVNPQATKVFAYTPRKEIWITYVGSGQTPSDPRHPENDPDIMWQCDKCAIWNWEWDTWYFYDIPKSYDINMCPPPDLDTPEWDDFKEEDDYWDSPKWETYQWSELGKDFINRIPYIASPDCALYTLDVGKDKVCWELKENDEHDPHKRHEVTRPLIAELLRTHLDMDEAVENIRAYKFLRRIAPQVRGFGKLHCSVGGSENSTMEPSWDNYQIYEIENDDKIDAFSNNRYPAIRFIDYGEGEWSFIGYDVDFVVEGSR